MKALPSSRSPLHDPMDESADVSGPLSPDTPHPPADSSLGASPPPPSAIAVAEFIRHAERQRKTSRQRLIDAGHPDFDASPHYPGRSRFQPTSPPPPDSTTTPRRQELSQPSLVASSLPTSDNTNETTTHKRKTPSTPSRILPSRSNRAHPNYSERALEQKGLLEHVSNYSKPTRH